MSEGKTEMGDDSLQGSHVRFQVDPAEEDARSHRGQESRHFMMSGIRFELDNTEKLREFQMKGAYWWVHNFSNSNDLQWSDLPLTLRLFCHGFWAACLQDQGHKAEDIQDFKTAADLYQKAEEKPFDELDTSQKEALFVVSLYLTEDHYAGLNTAESEAAEESLAAVRIRIPAVVNASFHD